MRIEITKTLDTKTGDYTYRISYNNYEMTTDELKQLKQELNRLEI